MNANRCLAASLRACLRRARGFAPLVLALMFLTPGQAMAWWSHDWAFRKQISLDTSAATSPVKGQVSDAVVLVRLHEGVFGFADASPEGADLRFVAGDDKTPLKYHIEKYDEVFNLAFVWVRVPQIKAGESQNIWMYYGNSKAASESDPRASYDADQTLVWHLSERNAEPQDATGFANHGPAAFVPVDSGLVGGAAHFDGSGGLALPSSLSAEPGQALTLSFWFKPAADGATALLFDRRDGLASFSIGLDAGVPYLVATAADGSTQRAVAAQSVGADRWHHLAVTAEQAATLYVDGVAQPSMVSPLAVPSGAAMLAGPAAGGAGAVFIGDIDELQVAKVARSAAVIALAASNQGTADELVRFGGDEAQSSWSTGYVGIILGSVTLDGWVIIGVLMIMMVISWVVMANKGAQIARVGKANAAFTELFRSVGGDFGALHHVLDGNAARVDVDLSAARRTLIKESPLARMFQTGVEELRRRLKGNGKSGLPQGVLSSQSIEAIRATIDAGLIRESQSLSSQLVLLTIAISGGPFIGLLGTVVGVMITFAAVASAGEVNVNAIAPGIAAALAATVAGLLVAVPALFGYNYLITRLKDVSAEMQVFVDAFIARMAEEYSNPAALHDMAD